MRRNNKRAVNGIGVGKVPRFGKGEGNLLEMVGIHGESGPSQRGRKKGTEGLNKRKSLEKVQHAKRGGPGTEQPEREQKETKTLNMPQKGWRR